MTRPIPFNVPFVTGDELAKIESAIDSGHLAGNGPFTKRVQRLLSERYSVPGVLLTHSCTAALELSALLLDVGPGDEVIVPSYTFATTASAFARTGASIVFAEIDPSTMNIDVNHVESLLTSRTRVVVPVHYGGIAADLKSLSDLLSSGSVRLVEDAAQALGAQLDGAWLGTIGLLGTISFHETKNLHSGLGGALFINDLELIDRAEDLWERGTNRAKFFKGLVDKYTWVEVGSSFYPSELQAAFLEAQLEHIDENLRIRTRTYELYDELMRPLADRGLFALPKIDSDRRLNGHSYFLICNSEDQADKIRIGLLKDQIHAYIGYVPLHSSPVGMRMGYQPMDLPVTETMAPRVLRLPMHHQLTETDLERIATGVERLAS